MRIVVTYGPKGGTGKTTLLAGLVGALSEAGRTLAVLDLDLTTQALTRFIESRVERGLPSPTVASFEYPTEPTGPNLEQAVDAAIAAAAALDPELLLIDTAEDRRAIRQLACERAHLILTPVQESPLEAELFADGRKRIASTFVKRLRNRTERNPAWLVAANRTPHLPTRVGRRMTELIASRAEANGYRFVPGARERVLYREMFETGITPFDPPGDNHALTMSKLSAKAELRLLAAEIGAAA